MSKRFSVHKKLVALCQGDTARANVIYDELVRRYYNTVSTFDGIYPRQEDDGEEKQAKTAFEQTQPLWGAIPASDRKKKIADSKLYLDRISNKDYQPGPGTTFQIAFQDPVPTELDGLRSAYLDFTCDGNVEKFDSTASVREAIDRLVGMSDGSSERATTIMNVDIPMDILKALALEIKSMSLVNKDFYMLEGERRMAYVRPAAAALVELDLTFLDTYESEMQSVALCMHPLIGTSAIAAYSAGMFAQIGAAYVKETMLPHSGSDPLAVTISTLPNNNLYAPDFTDRSGGVILRGQVELLHRSLSLAMQNRVALPGQIEIRSCLEEWLQLYDRSRVESLIDLTDDLNKEWRAWRLRALQCTRVAQTFILEKWRQNVLGSVFPMGDAFIESSINHMLRSVEFTGSVDISASETYVQNVLGTFYYECLAKKCHRKLADGSLFVLDGRTPPFEEEYGYHVENQQRNQNIKWMSPYEIIDLYRLITHGESVQLREDAKDKLAALVGKTYMKTVHNTTHFEPFELGSLLSFMVPNVGVFRHAFPASAWKTDKDRCVAGAAILYIRSLNEHGQALAQWLAGSPMNGTSGNFQFGDLVYAGEKCIRRDIFDICSALRQIVVSAGGEVIFAKKREQYADANDLVSAPSTWPAFPTKDGSLELCGDMDRYFMYKGVPISFGNHIEIVPFVSKTPFWFEGTGVSDEWFEFSFPEWKTDPWKAVYNRYDLVDAITEREFGTFADVELERYCYSLARTQIVAFNAPHAAEYWTDAAFLLFGMYGRLAMSEMLAATGDYNVLVRDPRIWAFIYVSRKIRNHVPLLDFAIAPVEEKDVLEYAQQKIEGLKDMFQKARNHRQNRDYTDIDKTLSEIANAVKELDNMGAAVEMDRNVEYAAVLAMTGRMGPVVGHDFLHFVALAASNSNVSETWMELLSGRMSMFDFLVPKEWRGTQSALAKLNWVLDEAAVYWKSVGEYRQLPYLKFEKANRMQE